MKLRSLEELKDTLDTLGARTSPAETTLVISENSTCCLLKGSRAVAEALDAELARSGMEGKVAIRRSGCLGFCEIEPMVIVQPQNLLYQKVAPQDASEIVSRTILAGEVVERLLYQDPATGERKKSRDQIPFYRKQQRIILGLNERIDPTSLEDYLAAGGYASLLKVFGGMSPEEVIGEITRSELRGRGGGGFPTGRKWSSCRSAEAPEGIRYVICNADEGDPGAYMDRSVLESNPHAVLEGMIVGSYAVGAGEGIIYVRAEYPLAVERLERAIAQAESRGLLGRDILGSGHDFSIRISTGAGAFVCGESTALMASLEGRVGRPRAKYVHTVEHGLWDRPSTLNNVETWANVPQIIGRGADWYRAIGTGGSKGTKIFSLVGKIRNTGLVEVPMGLTLREIIFEIGGGVPGEGRFKAVQTGGPSGGCLSEDLLDLPVDYDELKKAGSMMGSGGMIVMDQDTCMVDVARYFLDFLKGESCGKCVACREGIDRMHEIVARISAGEGREEDLGTLEELGEYLVDTALCALGATAGNPVLSTLKYFRDEYEAHVRERTCPAGVCRNLFRYVVDPDSCNGCTLCVKQCPAGAIRGERKQPHRIEEAACIKCGVCFEVCRPGAVRKVRAAEVAA